MRKEFIAQNAKQTRKLGAALAQELKSGKIICLTGELGSGKTTFTQGFLRGLKLRGPYTSPTFVIIKKYGRRGIEGEVYHIDAYRVGAKDILALGWEEIASDPKNIIIAEWADRIRKIIPASALWIKFEWLDENKRKIIFFK